MSNGRSLLGGYAPDSWQRNVASTGTYITGAATINGTNHDYTVRAASITSATVFEGFVVLGSINTKTSGNSYAIYVSASSSTLVIHNNVVVAGIGGEGGNGASGAGGVLGREWHRVDRRTPRGTTRHRDGRLAVLARRTTASTPTAACSRAGATASAAATAAAISAHLRRTTRSSARSMASREARAARHSAAGPAAVARAART